MNVRCADCNHKMLTAPDGSTQQVACERCGGTRLEPDQPSPVRGDGALRNTVDPGIGLDQGGNPNMEGIWANNGWQPYGRRDESYASVRTAMDFDGGDFDFESAPRVPTHHVIVDQNGRVYSGMYPETHEEIAERHRLPDAVNGVSKGALYPEGDTEWYTHDSGHNPAAMEQMLYGHFGTPVTIDPNLQATSEATRWGLGPGANPGGKRRELDILQGPANMRSWGRPRDSEGLVRGGHTIEANNMEALDEHFPFHVADAPAETAAPAQVAQGPAYTQEGIMPGSAANAARMSDGTNLGIHAGTTKWLNFLDAHVDGLPVRENTQHIIQEYGPRGSRYQQPVTVSAHHPEHLAAAIDVIEHSSTGGMPSPKMIDVGRRVQRGELEPPPGISAKNFKKRGAIYQSYGITRVSFLPLLLGLGAGAAEAAGAGGAEALGGAAIGSLMKGALRGIGSHLIGGLFGTQDAAGQNPSSGIAPPRDLQQLAKTADLETPHTNPGFHDSPDGDPHQFSDGDHSPNPENPNLNGEAGGSQLGEDNVGPAFGPNSPAMQRAELLMPAILHYYHSDQSAAQDPTIRELHHMLDKESPGYLDSVNDEVGAQAVQHLIDHMRKPEHIHAKLAAPFVYQNTPMDPAQMQMGPQQQVMPMHPGQPQQGPTPAGMQNCAYCGSTINPDGSCPQCGAMNNPMAGAPGIPQGPQGTGAQNAGNPQTTTPFVGKTAAPPDGPLPTSEYFKPNGSDYFNRERPTYQPCRYCGGSGWRMMGPCMYCGGTGKKLGRTAADTQGPQTKEQIAGNPMTTTPFVGKTAGPFDTFVNGLDQLGKGVVQGLEGGNPRCPYCGKRMQIINGEYYCPTDSYRTPIQAKVAADTQGPQTKEQIAAVQQLLIDTGRVAEVPNVPLFPEQYVDELQQVTQQNQTTPPPVDPNEQPAPQQPPMDPSMMGQMPMPGMTAPGGAPAASPFAMSKVDWGPRHQGHLATPHSGAPRCPECHSATTGFIRNGVEEVAGQCHACGNIWDLPEGSGVKTADFDNPVGVPAADQTKPYDPEADQDSSHSWTDSNGQPLVEGQEYELYTSTNQGVYPIPDRVRVDKIKPDELLYSTIGTFQTDGTGQNDPTMEYENRISLEEMQAEKYSFAPADDQNSDAGEQHLDEYQDTSQAPQFTEPVSQPGISPRGSVHEAVTDATAYDAQGQDLLAQWDTMTPEQQKAFAVAQAMRANNVAMQGVRQQPATHPPPYERMSPEEAHAMVAPLPGDPNYQQPKRWSGVVKTAPMSEYDHLFGGSGGAAKAMKAMKEKYGDEEGEKVFYATMNKRKKSSEDEPEHAEVPDDYCPRCASRHIANNMSSPVTMFHECYKCGHGWETREEDYETDGAQSRAWLHEAGSNDDFWAGYERARKMSEAHGGSRSLAAAAARDPRYAEISERLDHNKMAREAGKKFTPYEQRQMIDERGTARNADRLDLSGTHYESHRYLGERANGENVPDAELFLGL